MTSASTREIIEDVLGHELSDEQWAAVSSPAEPAAIIAGAGSGTTTVMSARVLWLVAEGYALPDEVLGLTFTTKAAGELLGRTRRLLSEAERRGLLPSSVSESGAVEPSISTYHSFASRLLGDHGVRLGLEPGAPVLADGARQALAARVVRATTLPLAGLGESPAALITAMLHCDDALAEVDLEPDIVLADAIDLSTWLEHLPSLQSTGATMLSTARVRAALCGLVTEFREAKLAEQSVDFADQVRLGLAIVRAAPDVGDEMRRRFPFVLLDEYQDTSTAQRVLLQTIFGEGHPVTAVGDPCQAIYEWRGASVDNIDRFPQHFPRVTPEGHRPAARYPLADNRRSGPRILDLANEIAAPLRQLHPGVEPLRAAATDRGSGEVIVGLHETYVDEVDWVCDRIMDLGQRDGSWSGIAVLARTGETLAQIDAALDARGVPTRLIGVAGLLHVPVVAEVRAILDVLDDPASDPALVRLLAGPRWRIGPRDLAALGALAADRSRAAVDDTHEVRPDVDMALRLAVLGSDPADRPSLAEVIEDVVRRAESADPPDTISPQALGRLGRFTREIRRLRRHLDEPSVEVIARVIRSTGLGVEAGLRQSAADNARALADFRELAARMASRDASGVGAFLSRLREAERFDESPRRDESAAGDAVVLMTIHRAKGLEFPHVVVAGMSEGVFPSARGRDRWPTNAAVVPWSLRPDAPPALLGFPDRGGTPRRVDHDEFIAASREVALAEERRLAYVAITRAERSLTVSGHWWGPSQRTPRGPGRYLADIHAWCESGGGHISTWARAPVDGDANPVLGERQCAWPVPPDETAQLALRAAAQSVEEARRVREPAGALDLSAEEARVVADWDAAAAALLHEARQAREPLRLHLPDDLSTSALVQLAEDPAGYALDLARPMPRRPHPAARRGTQMHAWIEGQYAVQTLFDLEALDAVDDLDEDPDLTALREAFRRSSYSARTPIAVEEPFAIALGGRVIRGRIDAVFASPSGRVEVIDWKSGGRDHLSDLQLAIYRCAWADLARIPMEQIDAAFLIVRSGEVVRPEHLADRAEIEQIISGR